MRASNSWTSPLEASVGIDVSLHLVGRVLGADAARKTARQMQYDWEPRALPSAA